MAANSTNFEFPLAPKFGHFSVSQCQGKRAIWWTQTKFDDQLEDCCKGVPSGNLLHSYEKWPIEIVDLPIKNGGSFHRFLGLFTISGNVFANQDMAAPGRSQVLVIDGAGWDDFRCCFFNGKCRLFF